MRTNEICLTSATQCCANRTVERWQDTYGSTRTSSSQSPPPHSPPAWEQLLPPRAEFMPNLRRRNALPSLLRSVRFSLRRSGNVMFNITTQSPYTVLSGSGGDAGCAPQRTLGSSSLNGRPAPAIVAFVPATWAALCDDPGTARRS